MYEVELKFQVPPARRRDVDAAVAGRNAPRRMRLQAAYVDTADRALASAQMALRVRREGRVWVQTLKGAADDGITRLEDNVALGNGAAVPVANPALHAGTEIGARLIALLAEQPDATLGVLYRTDIVRRTRLLRTAHGTVELAFDEGRIFAGEASLPVCELEIELKNGSTDAVFDTARRWIPRFGLWLDSRSKSERGDLLARGLGVAPPSLAGRVSLATAMDSAAAWQAVLCSCAAQIIANASQVASGEHGDGHVHQLRVGLRRLRSGLRFFELQPAPAWAEAVGSLFGQLGAARDQAVIDAEFSADLEAALQSTGADPGPPVAELSASAQSPTALLRQDNSQRLLLDLLAAMAAPLTAPAQEGPPAPLRAQLADRLARWHRRSAADAKRFADLDDEARHSLRKRCKRLRYAVEFCAALYPKRAVRAYLKPLRALQERLGAINDVVMAMEAFSARGGTDPRAWFALGWLAARRDRLMAEARPDLKAFVKARRFWRTS